MFATKHYGECGTRLVLGFLIHHMEILRNEISQLMQRGVQVSKSSSMRVMNAMRNPLAMLGNQILEIKSVKMIVPQKNFQSHILRFSSGTKCTRCYNANAVSCWFISWIDCANCWDIVHLPCRRYVMARHLWLRQRAPWLRSSAESGSASFVDAAIQAPLDDADCRPYASIRCPYRMVHFFVGFFDDCWGRGLRTALWLISTHHYHEVPRRTESPRRKRS